MIVFCEYAISRINLEAFQTWAAIHPELWDEAELLENTGQPGVFVEIWKADDKEHAARIQKERLEGRSEWRKMEIWVEGGADGLRVWTFRPFRSRA